MSKTEHVLVTGVAGFIGSNLLDYILELCDWKVTGVDNLSTGNIQNISHQMGNPRFTFIEADLREMDDIRGFDVVFHLAALPRIQPSYELITEHIEGNLNASLHLIELMVKHRHFPRLVYSGSSSIYGNPLKTPTNEDEPIKCMNPYAFQKYEVEKYLELLSERYPLNYVTLRYFNPYGPRSFNPDNPFNAYSSVVGIFMHRKKTGQPLLITGDGSQQRDFIHVRDVAAANVAAALAPGCPNKAFNIGQGETISVLNLAKMISPYYEFIPPRMGEAEITHADIRLAQDTLGWVPRESLSKYLSSNVS